MDDYVVTRSEPVSHQLPEDPTGEDVYQFQAEIREWEKEERDRWRWHG